MASRARILQLASRRGPSAHGSQLCEPSADHCYKPRRCGRAVGMSWPKKGSWVRRNLAGALLLLPVLLLQEAAFRWVFPTPEYPSFNRVHYGPRPKWVYGPLRENMNSRYLYRSKPDGTESINSVNVYGFRDPSDWPVAKSDGRTRVMFIGDSFVEGLLTDDEHTIPAQFAKQAEQAGTPVEVMNLGISGAGVSDYASLIHDAVPAFKPDVVMLVFYENDFPAPPLEFELARPVRSVRLANAWTPRAVTVVKRALNHRTLPRRRPGAISPVYFKVPDPGNPLSNPTTRARAERYVDPELMSEMTDGTLSPWLLDHLTHTEKSLRAPIDAPGLLRQLQAFTKEQGVKQLILAFIPPAVQVSNYYIAFAERLSELKGVTSLQGPEYQKHGPALATASAALGIPFLDFSQDLRKEEASGNHLYWNYDTHMRAVGYGLVARGLWGLYRAQH